MIANESIDYGKCTVIAAVCGAALAAISGVVPPSAIGPVLAWLSSIAGAQVNAWFSSKVTKKDPAAEEIFRNHDIQALLKRAVRKALETKAEKHKNAFGSVSDHFHDAAEKIADHLSKVTDEPAGFFAELYEGNITSLLNRYVESNGKTVLIESKKIWRKFVNEAITSIKLDEDEYEAIIDGLTEHFGTALWGIVKFDASQNGKGHAAVEMLYFSQILTAVSRGGGGKSLPECLESIVGRVETLRSEIQQDLIPFFLSLEVDLEGIRTTIEECHREVQRGNRILNEKIGIVIENQDRDSTVIGELKRLLESLEGSIRGSRTRDYEVVAALVAEKYQISVSELRKITREDAARVIARATSTVEEKIRALELAGEFYQALNVMLISASTLEERRREISVATAEMLISSATSEISLGLYQEALEHALTAAEIVDYERSFRVWSRARHQQGRAYFYMGQTENALRVFEELVPLRNRILGEEDEDSLLSTNSLAATYRSLGRFPEAVELVRRVIEVRRRNPHLDRTALLIAQSNLARTLFDQRAFAESLQLHEETLAERCRILGENHPDVLKSEFYVACCMCAMGRTQEGVAGLRILLDRRRATLGEEHPDTLRTLYELASVLFEMGRLPDALDLANSAAERMQISLGPDHPETVKAGELHATIVASKNAQQTQI